MDKFDAFLFLDQEEQVVLVSFRRVDASGLDDLWLTSACVISFAVLPVKVATRGSDASRPTRGLVQTCRSSRELGAID